MSVLRRGTLPLLIVALYADHVAADVCGFVPSETVWTAEESPVHVTCDLSVAGLAVEPGVTVLVVGNYEIVVNGVIRAMGTRQFPVVFKPSEDNPSGWGGFYFEDMIAGSEFRWVRIEGAISSGVHLVRSAPSFEHVTFENNSADLGGALRAELQDHDLVISETLFLNNRAGTAGGAIHLIGPIGQEDAALIVSDSEFRQNLAVH
jgi:predicted outer membrane repeat protein